MPALAHTRPDHDETLIARLAAADLDDRETAEAHALVTACPACAQLQADLRAIMVATAGLPAPRRTRDFRLTDADAARLRRTGWRRLVGRFGDPRLAFTRPLATGLVTLGIAGLVLAVGPSFLPSLGSAGGAPAQAPVAGVFGQAGSSQGTTPNAAASNAVGPLPGGGAVGAPSIRPLESALPLVARSAAPATSAPSAAGPASSAPAASSALASTAADLGVGSFSGPSPAAPVLEENPGVGKSTGTGESPGGPSPVVVVSLALVLVGSGLFLLRWAARRTA
jgi:hypothetical protein